MNRVPHRERKVLRILLQKIWWEYDFFNFIHLSISAFVRQSTHPSLHFVCFPSFCSIVWSFIHSFCFIRSIGRSIIHSYSLIHWFIDSLTRSFVHSFIHLFIHSFIHSFAGFVCSFVRSFVHLLFTQAFQKVTRTFFLSERIPICVESKSCQ